MIDVAAGTPSFPTDSRLGWSTASPAAGTFRVQVREPGAARPALGSGIYLPKSQSAWGFFPGTTEGGCVELTIPTDPPAGP